MSKDLGMKLLETMEENTQFEMEVPTMYTNSSEGTITRVSNYPLTRDKVNMKIIPSQRDDEEGSRQSVRRRWSGGRGSGRRRHVRAMEGGCPTTMVQLDQLQFQFSIIV